MENTSEEVLVRIEAFHPPLFANLARCPRPLRSTVGEAELAEVSAYACKSSVCLP